VAGIPAFLLLWPLRRRFPSLVPAGDPPVERAGLHGAIATLAVLLLLLVVAGAFLVHRFPGIGGEDAGEEPPVLLALGVDAATKLLAIGAGYAVFRRMRDRREHRAAPAGRAAAAGLLGGVGFLPLMLATVLVQQAIRKALGEEMQQQAFIGEAVKGALPEFLGVAVTAVVVAPFVEEVFFRGFLYSGLRAMARPAVAAAVAAAAFSFTHVEPDNLDALPTTFLLGLFLADLRERTGGLTAPVAMHACYNAFQLGGIWILRTAGGDAAAPGGG